MSAIADRALQEAIGITEAMYAAARERNWVLVAELEETREAYLRTAAAEPESDPAQLKALLDANSQLIGSLGEGREALLLEWAESRRASRALQDYDRIGRDGESA